MHQDAIDVECVILVAVAQRIRAVVRVQLAIADGDARQATAALRAEPLAIDPLVPMRLDQCGDVVPAIEFRYDLG
ncbi:hypothetical protein D3C76_1521030 [compost metagenome]